MTRRSESDTPSISSASCSRTRRPSSPSSTRYPETSLAIRTTISADWRAAATSPTDTVSSTSREDRPVSVTSNRLRKRSRVARAWSARSRSQLIGCRVCFWSFR